MMARTKKVTNQNFYDVFAEWAADDQARAIELLTAMNRQTYAFEKRLKKGNGGKMGPVTTTPIYPCPFCAGVDPYSHSADCPNKPAPVQTTIDDAIEAAKEERCAFCGCGSGAHAIDCSRDESPL
jgi:rubrerythrin